jgi:hypothetical protein
MGKKRPMNFMGLFALVHVKKLEKKLFLFLCSFFLAALFRLVDNTISL